MNARIKALETTNARLEALLTERGGLSRESEEPEQGEQGEAGEAGEAGEQRPITLPVSHVPILQPSASFTRETNGSLDIDIEDASSSPEFAGVLSALERLQRELPSHIVSEDAWSTPNVCRLWES